MKYQDLEDFIYRCNSYSFIDTGNGTKSTCFIEFGDNRLSFLLDEDIIIKIKLNDAEINENEFKKIMKLKVFW